MGAKSVAVAAVPRRLIVNADDFGRSGSINEAVIRAHREGVLTTASLMVNEAACAEAVSMAKANPGLGVGLHLTLLCGRSALSQAQIPGLVNSRNEFTDNSFKAGVSYYFNHRLRAQLRQEVHEQFKRFRATGLPLDHVNGHLHMHLHPVVFRILMDDAAELRIGRVRVTADPFWLNMRLAKGQFIYRLSHAVIFQALAARARRELEQRGFRHTQRVFGLLQNARVDEDYVHRLLARLPEGDSELYSHPSLDDFKHEFDALVSPRVRHQIEARRIKLIRYQDL
jgi:hopanoid biosynthesis associated protein HpnK